MTLSVFALLTIPFSLKIFWSPFVDYILPPFCRKSPRKGWVVTAVGGAALTLFFLSFCAPTPDPYTVAFLLFILALFRGCLYITGLSYELESVQEEQYHIGSSWVLSGYRIGLFFGGAGLLYSSSLFGWKDAFLYSSYLFLAIAFVILLIKEPLKSKIWLEKKNMVERKKYSFRISLWEEGLCQPIQAFFRKPEWKLVLACILLFKMGDQMAKNMIGPFYLSLGFTKADIATAGKMCGLLASILGAFCGGAFLSKKDPFIRLSVLGLIHALSLILFGWLSCVGNSLSSLAMTVALENFTGGMAMAAFISFLWKTCDRAYASVQYALLWSLFSIKGDLSAFCGGLLASLTPWNHYFSCVAAVGLVTSLSMVALAYRRSLLIRGNPAL